ncbi:STAS domain-containing protein [Streptomyces sp. NPDC016309]|uniref:STAS domain-containing protein n=1 Tax=Streptomyces sp. NPDC016309 TaxID=3364965 RepID=UPI0037027BCE
MPDELHIDVTGTPGGQTLLTVAGELDIVTGEELRARLHGLLLGPATVVVDLSAVTFLDCSGLRVLLWARRRSNAVGAELRLHAPSPAVRKILRVTRLEAAFAPAPEVPHPARG